MGFVPMEAAPGEDSVEETAETPAEKPVDEPAEEPEAPIEDPEEPVEAPAEELSSIEVGDIVTFGHYEQDGDDANGLEPIEWIVLDTEDAVATLISRYGLDHAGVRIRQQAFQIGLLRPGIAGETLQERAQRCRLRRYVPLRPGSHPHGIGGVKQYHRLQEQFF